MAFEPTRGWNPICFDTTSAPFYENHVALKPTSLHLHMKNNDETQSGTQSPHALWPAVGRLKGLRKNRKKLTFLIACPVSGSIFFTAEFLREKIPTRRPTVSQKSLLVNSILAFSLKGQVIEHGTVKLLVSLHKK